jgi:hypothetical protein
MQRITERQGVSLLSFLFVFSPIMLLLMSMAIDGLSAVATHRRAIGLADVAARAGAATLSYSGDRITVDTGWACLQAQVTLCSNIDCSTLNAVCQAYPTEVHFTVRLRPPRMLSGIFAIGPEWVSATIIAQPRSGIATQD